MKTMVDNAKIARMEKNIKETDAKVKNIKQVPPSTTADAGKVLTVNEDGSLSWQQKGAGGGMKAFFDAGGKCYGSTATSFEGIINFDDTSNVTDMKEMFRECTNLISIPLLNTSNVTNMYGFAMANSSLKSIPLLDTSNVTDMGYMLYKCVVLNNIPLFNTSNVTNMNSMLLGCEKLKEIPLFDTSKVTNMSNMFFECYLITSIPAFDVSNVTNMSSIFYRDYNLQQIHMKNIGVDLDIHYSTNFTREALLEIIGNLKTVTSTKTLTMGTTNLAKLTEEDKAIATNKGWTLA